MYELTALMLRARNAQTVIPAFNIPYLPIMEPVVAALRDCDCFGLIQVARLEWEKFEAKGLEAIRDNYEACKDDRYTRLHLDHVPVIDEDDKRVDYLDIIRQAIDLGYTSVMVDGSRLKLQENIAATRLVVECAHEHGVAVEAELGAVAGHEDGPMPDYEELFSSGMGFTDPEEASEFVSQTNVDWLSVAFGNIHGAISKAKRNEQKVTARLNIEQLTKLRVASNIPLVLHGGSGIDPTCVREAVANGVCKINIGTTIRQAYEQNLTQGQIQATQAVYDAACDLIINELHIRGNAQLIDSALMERE